MRLHRIEITGRDDCNNYFQIDWLLVEQATILDAIQQLQNYRLIIVDVIESENCVDVAQHTWWWRREYGESEGKRKS